LRAPEYYDFLVNVTTTEDHYILKIKLLIRLFAEGEDVVQLANGNSLSVPEVGLDDASFPHSISIHHAAINVRRVEQLA
jgi:hypothetical protein